MTRKLLSKALYHAIAVALLIIVVLPFFWMVSTSLKSRGALMVLPIEWIPANPTFDSFIDIFSIEGFTNSIFNSMTVSSFSVILTLVSSAMAAFAFSKIDFKGRGVLFMVFLATMMIPAQVLFIPQYLLMSELKLLDSLTVLIIPAIFRPFAVFMLRQQMMSISNTFMEAAALDGAGLWTTFIRIICPMCKAGFATLAVIYFMEAWNDYLLPLVMLSTKTKFTLPIILSALNGQHTVSYNLLMAGALVSMMPILILYACAQRYFQSGLQIGGIKG